MRLAEYAAGNAGGGKTVKIGNGGREGGSVCKMTTVRGLRQREVPTVATRLTAWARVASGTEASAAKAAQGTARVSTEGRYAWQDDKGQRGDEDQREDGTGSGEAAGALWLGLAAATVA